MPKTCKLIPNAKRRAIDYADWRYRDFEEVILEPMAETEEGAPRAPAPTG